MWLRARLLMVFAAVSVIVGAAVVVDWAAMSRHDIALPIGGRWYVTGRVDRWEFNFDTGGWEFFHQPSEGAFFPDGFNARLSLDRHYAPSSGHPAKWAQRTLGSIRIRDVVLASCLYPALWLVVTVRARWHR